MHGSPVLGEYTFEIQITSIGNFERIQFSFLFSFLNSSWGGCIVAICDSLENSAKYIRELKEKYFMHLSDYNADDADNVVFVTNPQQSAEVYVWKAPSQISSDADVPTKRVLNKWQIEWREKIRL